MSASMAEENENEEEKPAKKASSRSRKQPAKLKLPDNIVKLIVSSVADIADEDGYAFMGELGSLLIKKQPDFDPRNFGFRNLTSLVRSVDRFEVDVRQTADAHIKHIYLKDKEA